MLKLNNIVGLMLLLPLTLGGMIVCFITPIFPIAIVFLLTYQVHWVFALITLPFGAWLSFTSMVENWPSALTGIHKLFDEAKRMQNENLKNSISNQQ